MFARLAISTAKMSSVVFVIANIIQTDASSTVQVEKSRFVVTRDQLNTYPESRITKDAIADLATNQDALRNVQEKNKKAQEENDDTPVASIVLEYSDINNVFDHLMSLYTNGFCRNTTIPQIIEMRENWGITLEFSHFGFHHTEFEPELEYRPSAHPSTPSAGSLEDVPVIKNAQDLREQSNLLTALCMNMFSGNQKDHILAAHKLTALTDKLAEDRKLKLKYETQAQIWREIFRGKSSVLPMKGVRDHVTTRPLPVFQQEILASMDGLNGVHSSAFRVVFMIKEKPTGKNIPNIDSIDIFEVHDLMNSNSVLKNFITKGLYTLDGPVPNIPGPLLHERQVNCTQATVMQGLNPVLRSKEYITMINEFKGFIQQKHYQAETVKTGFSDVKDRSKAPVLKELSFVLIGSTRS